MAPEGHDRVSLRKRIGRALASAGLAYYDIYYGERDLAEPLPEVEPPIALVVRPATEEDRLAILSRANGSRAASFQRAFRIGSTCYVALVDGVVAGYSWVNRGLIDIPGLLTRKLPEDGAYNHNSFVFPEYRGSKVFQCLIARVAADMKTEGKAFVANTVNADNAPSVAARRHTGTKFRRCRILKPRFLPPLFLGRGLRPGAIQEPGLDDLR